MKSTQSFALGCLMLLCVSLAGGFFTDAAAQTKPEGEMRWALYVTIAPLWFDPGESVIGVLTPFWVIYALHDALVKPTPPAC
jgi:peptide/nickel transport system substrate-binding protein